MSEQDRESIEEMIGKKLILLQPIHTILIIVGIILSVGSLYGFTSARIKSLEDGYLELKEKESKLEILINQVANTNAKIEGYLKALSEK